MTETTHQFVVRVLREEDYWLGIPALERAIGSLAGDTLADLYEECESAKHFCLDLPKDTEVAVTYIYELPGVDVEVLDTYRHLRAERDTIVTRLDEAAKAAVSKLKLAGVSVRDSAAMLGLSPSRVDQIRHSI